jgi:hypothetical protein
MLVFTKDESRRWLCEHGLAEELTPLDHERARCAVEKDMGRRYIYSNMVANELISTPESVACVDITDWAVWPSIQNMDLFYAYRRSLGENRLLIDAHFHVFPAHEANAMRNLIHLGLISLFNVAGASTTTDFRFFASHDEWIELSWYEGAPWIPQMKWFFEKDNGGA